MSSNDTNETQFPRILSAPTPPNDRSELERSVTGGGSITVATAELLSEESKRHLRQLRIETKCALLDLIRDDMLKSDTVVTLIMPNSRVVSRRNTNHMTEEIDNDDRQSLLKLNNTTTIDDDELDQRTTVHISPQPPSDMSSIELDQQQSPPTNAIATPLSIAIVQHQYSLDEIEPFTPVDTINNYFLSAATTPNGIMVIHSNTTNDDNSHSQRPHHHHHQATISINTDELLRVWGNEWIGYARGGMQLTNGETYRIDGVRYYSSRSRRDEEVRIRSNPHGLSSNRNWTRFALQVTEISSNFIAVYKLVSALVFVLMIVLILGDMITLSASFDLLIKIVIVIAMLCVYIYFTIDLLYFIQTCPSNPPLIRLNWLRKGQDFVNQFYPKCFDNFAKTSSNNYRNLIGSLIYKCLFALIMCAMFWLALSNMTSAFIGKNTNQTLITDQYSFTIGSICTELLMYPFPCYVAIFCIDICYLLATTASEYFSWNHRFWRLFRQIRYADGFIQFSQSHCNRVHLRPRLSIPSEIVHFLLTIVANCLLAFYANYEAKLVDYIQMCLLIIFLIMSIVLTLMTIRLLLFVIYCPNETNAIENCNRDDED